MKKRMFAFLLAAVMCASILTGCSNSGKENNKTENETNAPVETPAEGEEKPAEDEENSAEEQPSVEEIVAAVKEVYGENYIPSMEMSEEMLSDVIGITMDDVEEFFAEGPMISAHIDSFIVLKAKEGKVDSLYEQLNQYREQQINDALCYPSNALRIQGSQVLKIGDYAIFILLGELAPVDSGEEDAVKFAEEQTQIGVDAINALFA